MAQQNKQQQQKAIVIKQIIIKNLKYGITQSVKCRFFIFEWKKREIKEKYKTHSQHYQRESGKFGTS